jgi:hypothetical protein
MRTSSDLLLAHVQPPHDLTHRQLSERPCVCNVYRLLKSVPPYTLLLPPRQLTVFSSGPSTVAIHSGDGTHSYLVHLPSFNQVLYLHCYTYCTPTACTYCTPTGLLLHAHTALIPDYYCMHILYSYSNIACTYCTPTACTDCTRTLISNPPTWCAPPPSSSTPQHSQEVPACNMPA